jgi:hypothetical protein
MGVATSPAFTVPDGYVAILRAFRFVVDPVLDLPCTDVLISILIDDIPQNNYDRLPLGSEQDIFLPTWILADNGQRIALRYDNSAAVTSVSVEVCVTFYGNLLLRTGVPIEYEHGNPSTSQPIVRGTVLKAGGGVESEPGRRAGGRAVGRVRRGRPTRYRRPTRSAPAMSLAQRRRANIARQRARFQR